MSLRKQFILKTVLTSCLGKETRTFPVNRNIVNIVCSRYLSQSRSVFSEKQNIKWASSLSGKVGVSQTKPRILSIGVQGAAFDKGQPKEGVADGPTVIRSSGFMEFLRNIVGHDVLDYGNIPLDVPLRGVPELPTNKPEDNAVNLKNIEAVAKANQSISEATAKIVKSGKICLTLGGDHSIGIGTVHGVSEIHNDLAVLWVDAHCDINTALTTDSGNLHGMSMAFVVKELQPYMEKHPEFLWVTPRIHAQNVAYIGLRDVDSSERAILDTLGITAYSMKEVDRLGILKVTQLALEKICPGNKRPLHVSFDIDSLDDTEVSNTGTPVPGGLTLREGITILEEVYDAGNMVSMDLVEVNPMLGNTFEEKRTAAVAKQLLINAFGYYRGGIANGPVPSPKS